MNLVLITTLRFAVTNFAAERADQTCWEDFLVSTSVLVLQSEMSDSCQQVYDVFLWPWVCGQVCCVVLACELHTHSRLPLYPLPRPPLTASNHFLTRGHGSGTAYPTNFV